MILDKHLDEANGLEVPERALISIIHLQRVYMSILQYYL
jgi:hypothetical protein